MKARGEREVGLSATFGIMRHDAGCVENSCVWRYGLPQKSTVCCWTLALIAGMNLLGGTAARAGGTVTACTEAALRAAMAGGGTVAFACDGTITLAATITNTADAVLDGSGHQVTISGGDAVRVFCVTTNVSFQVTNLTIAHGLGRNGGGILNLGGNVLLDGVLMQANSASCDAEPQVAGDPAGGGIFNQGGSVVGANCVFSGNTADHGSLPPSSSSSRTRGGALCNESGEIRLQSCSFYSNSVTGAPRPYVDTAHNASGGAIANSGTLAANLCTFSANSAAGGVGGGDGGGGGAGSGGAVCNLGILELSDSTFLSNVVSGGVGGEGAASMLAAYFGGPGGLGGPGNGGGLFNAGVATVAGCFFTGNIGRGGDGGRGGFGAMGTDFGVPGPAGNGGDGGSASGAVCDLNALCLLTNCTVSANSGIRGAGGPGGFGGAGTRYDGYRNGADGQAGHDGQAVGGLRSVGAIVMNTVLTANAPGGDCSGTFTDAGQNACSDGSCGFTNQMPPTRGPSTLPPFYLLHNFTGQEAYLLNPLNGDEADYVDAHPFGALVTSFDGRFYGVTTGGGLDTTGAGAGAVFMVNSNGTDSSFTVLQGFTAPGGFSVPGAGPSGTLALSGDVLYGTTVWGGQSDQGSVFRINTDGSGYEIVYSFVGPVTPSGGLVASGSTLFGTTSFGGSSGSGSIFQIQTDGSGYRSMHDFLGGANGAGPAGELLLSGSTLYGTTLGGGYPNAGTVFKINTNGSGFTVLKWFDAASGGALPSAGLAISGSTLFGTTASTCYNGSPGCGAVFTINTNGSGFSILQEFPGSDGPGQHAGLIFSAGKLYGTTGGDGSLTNGGSVFMINADGSGYTVLKRFNGMDGAGPNGDLLLVGHTLYGTTENGGLYGAGVAFALSLSPAVIPSPLVSIQRTPTGITITFSGTLQSADGPTGPWTDLQGPSPQTITPAGAMKFYRARS